MKSYAKKLDELNILERSLQELGRRREYRNVSSIYFVEEFTQ